MCLCGALAIMGNITGCADVGPAGPASQDEPATALRGADVGRAIAGAMADAQVRAAVRDAMVSSPFSRHRIVLQSFLQTTAGTPLLTGMARSLRTSPEGLAASLTGMPSLELYLPRRADRVSWSGSANLAVAAAVDNGEVPDVAFRPGGGTVPVAQLRAESREAAPAAFVVRPARSQLLRTEPSLQPSGVTVQDAGESDLAVSSVTHRGTGDSADTEPVFLEECDPNTDVLTCGGGGGGGGAPPASTYLGVLWVIHSADNGSFNDALELRFESYWTRNSDGARMDHTTLGYDALNSSINQVNGVLSPHVFNGVSGFYIHTEVWENDGWWGDDHYGDADITHTYMYYPHGSAAPGFLAGESRCGYEEAGFGSFQCPPVGQYQWSEVTFNIWHN